MRRNLFRVFVVSLFALVTFTASVDALVLGPIAQNGFPAWIGDGTDAANPGLRLQPCLAPGNHNAGIGPCLAGPGEFPFFVMEVIPETPPPGVTDLRIIVEIVGARERDPELGPGLLNIIGADIICRLRGTAVQPGQTYTFATPFGSFPFVAVDDGGAGRIQEGVTGLHSVGPAFAELLDPALNPIQTFLRADQVQAGGVNPPIGFIGDGITPMTGAGFAFSVTGPGVDFSSAEAAVQGKIFDDPGGLTATLTGTGAARMVEVTGLSGTLTPTFGGVRFTAAGNTIGPPVRRVPPQVADVVGGPAAPTSVEVTNVQDTVTIISAAFNRAGSLRVRARSNMTPAPTLTITDANGTFVGTMKRAKTIRAARLPAGFTGPITVTSTAGGIATADVTAAP